jgi:hypothetical protein
MTATGGSGKYSWRATGLPDGVNIDANTGTLSGIPNQFGQGLVVITATDTADPRNNTSRAYLMFISQGVSLTNSFSNAHLNAQYVSPLPVFGAITSVNITAGALPPGLQITTDSNGIFQVTGTATQAGTFTFTLQVTASDPSAEVVTQPCTITVDSALAIAQTRANDAVFGTPYSFTFSAVNGTPPYTWSLTPPFGMTFDSASGTLSGAPNSQVNFLQLTVTDSSPSHNTASLSTELDAPLPLALSPIVEFTLNRPTFQQGFASGGKGPIHLDIISGAFPPGMQLNTFSLSLGGTARERGSHPVTVRLTDGSQPPQSVEGSVDFHVSAAVLFSSPRGIGKAVRGVPYSDRLQLQGGTAPYHWSTLQGQLPPGLSLDSSTGVISGTPTATGSYSFAYRLVDSSSPPQNADNEMFFFVSAAAKRNDSIANATPIGEFGILGSISPYEDGDGGDQDYYRIVAAPTTTPVVNLSTQGSFLPVLELLDSNGTRLSGCRTLFSTAALGPCLFDAGAGGFNAQTALEWHPPTQTTPVTSYIHVLDRRGIARPDFSYSMEAVNVLDPPQFGGSFAQVYIIGKPIDGFLQGGGGPSNPATWSIVSGSLPDGLSLGPDGHLVGTPTTLGSYDAVLRLTDSSNPPLTSDKPYNFRIVDPIKITTTALPDGTAGVPYHFALQFTGGEGNVLWQSNSDVPGLQLNSLSGNINIANPVAGTYTVNIDATSPTQTNADGKAFTLVIH